MGSSLSKHVQPFPVLFPPVEFSDHFAHKPTSSKYSPPRPMWQLEAPNGLVSLSQEPSMLCTRRACVANKAISSPSLMQSVIVMLYPITQTVSEAKAQGYFTKNKNPKLQVERRFSGLLSPMWRVG